VTQTPFIPLSKGEKRGFGLLFHRTYKFLDSVNLSFIEGLTKSGEWKAVNTCRNRI